MDFFVFKNIDLFSGNNEYSFQPDELNSAIRGVNPAIADPFNPLSILPIANKSRTKKQDCLIATGYLAQMKVEAFAIDKLLKQLS